MPTQHQKIIEICLKSEWVCQASFWNISKSPHKRRNDIFKKGIYKFIPRPCEHGIKASNDYKMILQNPEPLTRRDLPKELIKLPL